eukprot:1046237-Prorocentrum_minimum.AAC.1
MTECYVPRALPTGEGLPAAGMTECHVPAGMTECHVPAGMTECYVRLTECYVPRALPTGEGPPSDRILHKIGGKPLKRFARLCQLSFWLRADFWSRPLDSVPESVSVS